MSDPATVLVIAEPNDAEAERVAEELAAFGATVCWLDTAEFPSRIKLLATLGATEPGWLITESQKINLARVRSVYRRYPAVFRLDDEMSPPERRFALMEAVQGVGGVLTALECKWVNHPSRVADASYKPVQLCIARKCGLLTPRTLVTNVGSAARKFVRELGGRAIYKPMSPGVVAEMGRVRVLNATLISPDVIDDDAVSRTAHTFQQWIDKSFDARVTVVGERCFAVAINAATEAARTDWRADYDALTYRVVDVPDHVKAGIHRYLARFGLLFAAFDFSVAQDGTWWFLEANPNGLWAWLEERTGLAIGTAIAETLISEAR
jgi:ATP-grasp ribosomal peptide maturase